MRALFIRPNPDTAFAYLPEVILAAGVTREVIERETQEAAAAAKGHFVDWRKRNNVPEAAGVRLDSCFASWSEQLGDIETVVARFGRVSDLIVVQRPSSSSVQGQRCFDAAVFESGRPTLVVAERLPFDIIDHVMIAWNGSLEASRAVLGAMPLLHLAARVSRVRASTQPISPSRSPGMEFGLTSSPALETKTLREPPWCRPRSNNKRQ
jgi:hypothetical protein